MTCMQVCVRWPQPTWETDNGVSADGCVWHVAADVVHDGGVACCGVAPLHESQDVVIPALEGDVEELAELGKGGAGLHQAVWHRTEKGQVSQTLQIEGFC